MAKFEVEVVFALPEAQSLQVVAVEAGATAADCVARSGIEREFPERDLSEFSLGIWGREVERSQVVKEGDRVEIYRPLELDPREARRQLALAGRTMSKPDLS
jgi:putative ubiquitin-RnfH superfamily antitoxin RatB of RatAB toxin-antitoxin module